MLARLRGSSARPALLLSGGSRPAFGGGREPPYQKEKIENVDKTGFDAYDNAVEISRAMRDLVKAIKAHDADLADQAKRATQSIGLNVAEGRRRAGKDRLYAFRVALASTSEVRGALDQAEAWGYLEAERTETARGLVDREERMLSRLCGG